MKLRLYVCYADAMPVALSDWIDKGVCDPVPPGNGPTWGWQASIKGGEFVFDFRGAARWNFMKLVPVEE